jgi:predicted transcriptional regulator
LRKFKVEVKKMAQNPDKIKLSLEIPLELNARLEEIARELGSTKSDVLRRALALMEVAHEARKQNKIVGVLTKEQKLEKEFIGI